MLVRVSKFKYVVRTHRANAYILL